MKLSILRAQISKILMRQWDPAGVFEVTEAQDEYDTYANDLFHLILNGANRNSIKKYICNAQIQSFGFDSLVSEKLIDDLASLGTASDRD